MSAPTPSKLDHQQVLQGSYDESVGALRVEGTFGGSIEVIINSSTDSIAIGNAGNAYQLLVNSDGSINVKLETESIEIGKVDQGNPNTTTNAWPIKISDNAGNVVGPEQTLSGTNYLPVVLAASTTPGSALVPRSIQIAGSDGTNSRTISTDTNGKININYLSGTSTITSVASSASNVTLLAANTSRKGAILYNNSNQTCYMKLGITASNSSFTIAMLAGSTFIIDGNPVYDGEVDGIWVSANGAMLVTELT